MHRPAAASNRYNRFILLLLKLFSPPGRRNCSRVEQLESGLKVSAWLNRDNREGNLMSPKSTWFSDGKEHGLETMRFIRRPAPQLDRSSPREAPDTWRRWRPRRVPARWRIRPIAALSESSDLGSSLSGWLRK